MKNKTKKKQRQLSLKVDFAFKSVFGDERHIESLKYLLYTILGYPKDMFEDIHILNTEQTRTYYDGKEPRLDIVARLKNGENINIEMQMNNLQSNTKRFLLYWSTVYSRQLKKGHPYDNLKKTISINLLNYELADSNKIHSVYHITEDETGSMLTDMLEIHTIELGKLDNSKAIEKETDEFIRLMKFISSDDEEERKMLSKYQKELIDVIHIMDTLTDDDEQWYAYLSREKFLRDQVSREYHWKNVEDRVNQLKTEVNQLQAEVKQQQSEIKQQQAEVKQQQAEVKQQQSEIKQQQAEVKQQQAEVKQQQSEIEQQQAEVKQKQLEMQQQSVEIEQKTAQIEQKSAEIEQKINKAEKRGMVKILIMQDKTDEEIMKLLSITEEQLDELKA